VPSAHDDNVRSGHMRFAQLTFPPQTAFDRFQSRCFPPRRNDLLKMSSCTPLGRRKSRFDVDTWKSATVIARPSGTTSKCFASGWGVGYSRPATQQGVLQIRGFRLSASFDGSYP
jgi:hypothetical protein